MQKASYGKNLFFSLSILILAFVIYLVSSSENRTPPVKDSEAEIATASVSGTDEIAGSNRIVEIAKIEKPAVVNIGTTRIIKGSKRRHGGPFGEENPFHDFFDDDFFEKFFGEQYEGDIKRKSLGSGFIIDKDGYILTNNHVVEKADEIVVTMENEKQFKAEIIGNDPKTDIALIKIESKSDLPVSKLGDSDKLQVGEWVVAIGNPFGLDRTVTVGVVSAKERNIGSGPYDEFIQTDASINFGNSGGPLLNMKGEVVGINTAIIAGGQGIGFAVPINVAKNMLGELKEKGSVTRGWLGVLIQKVSPELAKSFGLKDRRGALVSDVFEDSPAEKAGIKRGDIIVGFDGKKIKNMEDLPRIVASTKPEKKVTVTVIRNGKEKSFKVEIGVLKEDKEIRRTVHEMHDRLGMEMREITSEIAERYNLEDEKGLIVSKVKRGGPADDAGIRRGDIIIEINRKKISTLKEYEKILDNLSRDEPVLFLLKRGGNTLFVAVKPEDK